MNPAAFNAIPEHQKPELMAAIDQMQMRDSMKIYNVLVEKCFAECISGFRSKALSDKESGCVTKCAEKYIKLTQRVGFRFAEHQETTK